MRADVRQYRRARSGAFLLIAGAVALLVLASQPGRSLGATPSLTDNGATTIYYDGAGVTGSLNSGGDPYLVTLSYGVTGGTQTMPNYWSQPDAKGNVSVGLTQLAPATQYSYQWILWDQTTQAMTMGPSGVFTTGTLSTAAATPIIPPTEPASDGAIPFCSTDADCLSAINGVRNAQEHLAPLALPTNWSSLTGAEQIFVFTNMERVSRGETPITALVNTYDSFVQTGMTTDTDPNLPIGSLAIEDSGPPTPLGAMYVWMYYDGYGSANPDCQSAAAGGCWSHRRNLLATSATTIDPDEIDVVAGTDARGVPAAAAALWSDNGTAPAANNVVMTWASEQQYLTAAPANGTQPPPPPGPPLVSTQNCQNCKPPLTNGGGPVLDIDGTPLTVTPIWWIPGGYALPTTTYQSLIDKYLTDVAQDSGRITNVFSVATEYGQINYNIAYTGDQTDTDAYPGVGSCTVPAGFTACLTNTQMQAELTSYLAATKLPEDSDHVYVLMLPGGVATASLTPTAAFPANYCATHSYVQTATNTYLWTSEPAPTATACNSGQAPNGDAIADSEISILSGELIDTITDPMANAWLDSGMHEIADECASTFGTPLGSTNAASPGTSEYNQVINGDNYYVQEMFSNADYATGPNRGCVQSEVLAQADVTAAGATPTHGLRRRSTRLAATAAAASQAKADVVSVTSQHYALNGSQVSVETVHVDAPSGAPVKHDHVIVDLTANTDETNPCGRLSVDRGFTNAAGNFVTSYTAAAENTECTLIAIEGNTGQHGMGTLYLGKDSSLCPLTSYSAPASLTQRRSVAFAAQVRNPSDAIPDAVTQVVIAGDDTARTGARASAVSLSWRVGTGRWAKVRLSGTTRNGGAITGDLEALPATLPAKSVERLHFRLEVSGVPAAGALSFGLSVNQVNEASGDCDGMYVKTTQFRLLR